MKALLSRCIETALGRIRGQLTKKLIQMSQESSFHANMLIESLGRKNEYSSENEAYVNSAIL